MGNLVKEFDVWVELDEYDKTEENRCEEEFCNVIISFVDGSQVGLNVWSEKYLYSEIDNLDWIDEQVAVLPDLVVRDFNSSAIRQAIVNLVNGSNWLEGRGFPVMSEDIQMDDSISDDPTTS